MSITCTSNHEGTGPYSVRVPDETLHSVAAYATYERSATRFDAENRRCKAQKQTFRGCEKRLNAKTSYAIPGRLAGHKGLGRLMDSAWIGFTALRERAFT